MSISLVLRAAYDLKLPVPLDEISGLGRESCARVSDTRKDIFVEHLFFIAGITR